MSYPSALREFRRLQGKYYPFTSLFDDAYAPYFQALTGLSDMGQPIDVVQVATWMRTKNLPFSIEKMTDWLDAPTERDEPERCLRSLIIDFNGGEMPTRRQLAIGP